MRNLKLSLLLILALAVLASTANAETMTFGNEADGSLHADVYVRGGGTAGNNFDSDVIRDFIGPIGGTDTPARSYFAFDISALPAGADIESVTLTLMAREADGGSSTDDVTYELRSTTTFSESTITFNNAPAMGSLLSTLIAKPGNVAVRDTLVYGSTSAFASAAQTAFDANATFYFAAKAADDTSGRNLLRVDAYERDGHSFSGPRLDVTYSVVPEPSTITLLSLMSLGIVVLLGRKRR